MDRMYISLPVDHVTLAFLGGDESGVYQILGYCFISGSKYMIIRSKKASPSAFRSLRNALVADTLRDLL